MEDSVGPRIFYLALNNEGIMASQDLRQAVAQAMTTDFTAQFGDLVKPWNQLISSTTVQSDPAATTTYPYDPEAAAALLESAGYDGTPVRIVYDVSDPYGAANATALRQDLEAVGFTIDLQGFQKEEFYSTIYDPTVAFDISSTYWSADYPDAQDFISTNFLCGVLPEHLALLRRGHRRGLLRDGAHALRRRAGRRAARGAAAPHRRAGRCAGHGGHAAGRLRTARGGPADPRHVRPVRLEAGLGEGGRLSPPGAP